MLEVRLLGQFSVQRDDEAVALRSRPAQSLLAYLILNAGVPQRRERVAGLLWPESTETNARSNLRHALWRVRKALGDCPQTGRSYIRADDLTIAFDAEADYWLDVVVVEREVGGAGSTDTLLEAVSAYQGELLPGSYDDWVTLERERLQAVFERKMQQLVDALVGEGRWSEVVEWGEAWIALGQTPEPAYRALMVAHSAGGDRSSLAATYQRCGEALRRELGVEVSPQTRELYESLSTAEVGVAVEIRRPETRAAPEGPRHNLPVQAMPFVGREIELAEIEARLQDPDCRLLTLVGPGGSGKTRLAIEIAGALVDDFEHGVWFVSLAGLHSPETIAPAVAQAIGLSFRAGADPEEQLLAYLAQRHLLLILDNVEHLIAAQEGDSEDCTALVSAIVEAAPGVKALVTSRAALRVQHERLFPISGMACPELAAPGTTRMATEVVGYSAPRLFLEAASRVAPHFRMGPDNAWHVSRICRLVAGMPLGILLAASWVRMLAPEEIAAQLEHGLDVLETDLRDVPERQRSMRAVFDHSWKLLTVRERAVMQALSIFRGGFSLEAAREVAGASLRDLLSLVDRSLVQPVQGARYQVHELLRQYAAERLDEDAGRCQAAHDRHSDYYTAALEALGEELKGPRRRQALSELDNDIGNVRAAWDWAVLRGAAEQLSQGAGGLFLYYEHRGLDREGMTAFGAAADSLRGTRRLGRHAGRETAIALVEMLQGQGAFACRLGSSGLANDLLDDASGVLQRFQLAGKDTRSLEAGLLYWLGTAQSATGRGDGKESLERSLATARSEGDLWRVAMVLDRLALSVDVEAGEFREARMKHEESRRICQARGDEHGLARATVGLAFTHLVEGDLEMAERLAREGLLIWRALGNRVGIANALGNLVLMLHNAGKYAESQSIVGERLAILGEVGFSGAGVLLSLCYSELHQGRYKSAREYAESALEAGRRTGDLALSAYSGALLGLLAVREGGCVEAVRFCRESMVARDAGSNPDTVVFLRCALAFAELGLGASDDARRHTVQALRWLRERRSFPTLIYALPLAALALLDQSETERAVEIYALACTLPAVANSVWFDDVVGKPIAQASGSLPAAVVAAAKERGRARDVNAVLDELLVEWSERTGSPAEAAHITSSPPEEA